MNSKQLKKLRRLIKPLQVEWLQSILPEDQGKAITVDNVNKLIPDQTHMFGNRQIHLSFMSKKHVYSKHLFNSFTLNPQQHRLLRAWMILRLFQ